MVPLDLLGQEQIESLELATQCKGGYSKSPWGDSEGIFVLCRHRADMAEDHAWASPVRTPGLQSQ